MQELFIKYLENQCSPEEIRFLLKEFEVGKNEEFLKSLIRQQLEAEENNKLISEKETEDSIIVTYVGIQNEINTLKNSEVASVIPFYKQTWFRIAAATVLIFIAGGTLLLLNRNNKHQQIISHQELKQDIAPGGNKAVLTLSDNSTIILDNAAIGALAQQGNTKVLKLNDGQLVYNTEGKPAEVLYNTITTPRGGQYQLTLSDGSKVWLNAASSIRFPAAFVGKERKVEITGEAYFEVAKNTSMPFKVIVADKAEVEVLGTHFNINSYNDEETINTTLLEGLIKITGLTTQNSKLLSPGQQAQLNSNGQINVNKNANIEEVMAWKNEKFVFQDADIKSVMRQIERWYDVEVAYEGNITNEEFIGIISRNVNVSQILKMLEKTGAVKFEIVGKKIIVK